jgi:alanine-glyoxylate transaminase/serine-glyoxylate transaminase/serine-pyruvate transaminase
MGPGPSDVHPRILSAMARPTIGHLDPAFVGMMNETKEGLKTIFKTENELTMPVSAPGSAGMETCFANLVEPGDKVVVCRMRGCTSLGPGPISVLIGGLNDFIVL